MPVTTRVTYRSVVVLAALVVVPGLGYLVGVLLPYFANDLDTLSVAELAAGEQPATGPVVIGGGWPGILGLYSLVLAPLGALVGLAGCAMQLAAVSPRSARRASPSVVAGLVVVAVICIVAVAWFLSPLGRALGTWFMD